MKTEFLKWLPIVLSVIAVAISSISLWESHRNRVINEEINRPILAANTPVFEGLHSNSKDGIRVTVKLKNVGKSTARLEDLEIWPRVTAFNPQCKIDRDVEFEGIWGLPTEILAGSENTFQKPFALTPECEKVSKLFISVHAVAIYADAGSGRLFRQVFETDLHSWPSKP